MAEPKKILNVGSGKDKSVPGSISIDKNPVVSPDVVHDLTVFPWPFEAESFDAVYCKDVIEHVPDIVRTMEEIHRISKPGASVHITTPHFSCYNSYSDPTHVHHLGIFSFDYFTDASQWNYYTKARFHKKNWHLYFFPGLLNKILWRLAKKYPEVYEKHLTWVFPAWFLSFELTVQK